MDKLDAFGLAKIDEISRRFTWLADFGQAVAMAFVDWKLVAAWTDLRGSAASLAARAGLAPPTVAGPLRPRLFLA